jgi:lysophospholipid acyltransferase (LPLAT)-like uncharacterized protein
MIKERVIGFIIYLITRIIYLTTSKQYHIQGKVPQGSYIHAMWHRNLILQPYIFRHLNIPSQLHAFISRSRDGQIIANIYKHLGIDAVRGSSSKGASVALLEAIKLLQDNKSVIITPDGPRGPIYSMADGVYHMAKKSQAPVLLSSVVPSSYWQFKSWDRFVLPKPFARLDIYIETISVDTMPKEETNAKIKERLMKYVF